MRIDEIKKLIEGKFYSQALHEINLILENKNDAYYDALRQRAYLYNLLQDYTGALKDRLEIINSDNCLLKDYFLAANEALYVRDYSLAKDLLAKLLQLSKETKNNWFDSSAYFILAYCHMNMGDYDSATKNLDLAESMEEDVSYPIPGFAETCDAKYLRNEIKKRRS